jgi:2-hydroxy-3-keto-5-methylthiopentenyl-1-phosphate phosphatase
MPRIEKRFDVTISKKFPDGGLISATFGTCEVQDLRDELSLDGIEEAKKVLFDKVHANTISDIQMAVQIDPIVRSIWKTVKENLKFEKKVAKAEKDLDSSED